MMHNKIYLDDYMESKGFTFSNLCIAIIFGCISALCLYISYDMLFVDKDYSSHTITGLFSFVCITTIFLIYLLKFINQSIIIDNELISIKTLFDWCIKNDAKLSNYFFASKLFIFTSFVKTLSHCHLSYFSAQKFKTIC